MNLDNGARCVTCGEGAVAARLVAQLDEHTARVQVGDDTEDVCIDLVEARVGDVVLVQAGVAIGVAS